MKNNWTIENLFNISKSVKIFTTPLPLILVTVIFFQSCEKFTLPTDVEKVVNDQNKTLPADGINVPISIKTEPIKVPNRVEQKTVPVVIQQPVPQEEVAPTIIREEPKFSEELLKAVQNWTRVPKSVFPARPVLSKVSINLEATTSSGQVIANSLSPAGSELQVLGMRGNTLVVANPNNAKLRGEVNIDQTDFKQLLAYRFELNKRKRAELDRRKEKTNTYTAEKNPNSQKSRQSEKIDEIPDPLDFGHGRFCICKDCREKRLATTGSLKSGFGIDP